MGMLPLSGGSNQNGAPFDEHNFGFSGIRAFPPQLLPTAPIRPALVKWGRWSVTVSG
jgi:hypothetical protein